MSQGVRDLKQFSSYENFTNVWDVWSNCITGFFEIFTHTTQSISCKHILLNETKNGLHRKNDLTAEERKDMGWNPFFRAILMSLFN